MDRQMDEALCVRSEVRCELGVRLHLDTTLLTSPLSDRELSMWVGLICET